MQEVVRAKVLKLLQAGIIYPISDSTWVSPTQVMPKKSGVPLCIMKRERKCPPALPRVGEYVLIIEVRWRLFFDLMLKLNSFQH